jgi:hypothetical protein
MLNISYIMRIVRVRPENYGQAVPTGDLQVLRAFSTLGEGPELILVQVPVPGAVCTAILHRLTRMLSITQRGFAGEFSSLSNIIKDPKNILTHSTGPSKKGWGRINDED